MPQTFASLRLNATGADLWFWGFITTALVAFGAAKDYPRLQLLAACYGFLCSLAWSLQNRGSKYWHESWEAKVEKVERDVLGTNLFSNKEPIKRVGWLSAKRYSSSRLVISLSEATTTMWLALVVAACRPDLDLPFDWIKAGTLAVTAVFVIQLLVAARSR
jgi:hypothetical protein